MRTLLIAILLAGTVGCHRDTLTTVEARCKFVNTPQSNDDVISDGDGHCKAVAMRDADDVWLGYVTGPVNCSPLNYCTFTRFDWVK